MFDTNIFNRILDGGINISDIKTDDRIYYATHIQLDEISNTKDINRRTGLEKIFHKITDRKVATESAAYDVSRYGEAKYCEKIVPTESCIVGVSRVGMSKLSNGNIYNSLLKELNSKKARQKMNNIKDALIAETAIKNKFILVTEDTPLCKIANSFGSKAISWDNFIKNKGKL